MDLLDMLGRAATDLTDGLLDRRLRLAVTGLRRSGKTVFITSLVHHLIDGADLPFLRAAHEKRLLGARLVPPLEPPAFPYPRFHADLTAATPRWPDATETLSSLRLEVRFRSDGIVSRYLQPQGRLFLDIVDYPGEWLLDLPLLDQSFEEFAAEALALAETPARRMAAEPWLAALATVDPAAPADTATVTWLAGLFRDYLTRCQRELGLSRIVPGRFVAPGPWTGSDVTSFCPLPAAGAPGAGSLTATMRQRFERYREDVVRSFYVDHFSRFDRQIVLVDLLSSLNAGPDHFADTEAALGSILKSFRYGSAGRLARLFSPRVDRLLFAASKADHVAANQHPNLKQLLELMLRPAAQGARFAGVDPEVLALAALRCTDTVATQHHGQTLSCVRGRLKDEERETVLFPGEIPAELPDAADWRDDRFRFREFAPRRLRHGAMHQHLRLDQAIEYLIGDRLA